MCQVHVLSCLDSTIDIRIPVTSTVQRHTLPRGPAKFQGPHRQGQFVMRIQSETLQHSTHIPAIRVGKSSNMNVTDTDVSDISSHLMCTNNMWLTPGHIQVRMTSYITRISVDMHPQFFTMSGAI